MHLSSHNVNEIIHEALLQNQQVMTGEVQESNKVVKRSFINKTQKMQLKDKE